MRSTEDRYFLEGLALWAGHDYSDPFGSEVCWFVDCYRKAVMRKHDLGWTYQAWSAAVQRFLDGERVLRESAEISVASMRCRGLKHPLFAPQNLIDKINRNPNGKEDLLHYVQSANPPKVRDFTRFMALDIATRVHPWPVQKDVDERLAPLQILDSWAKHQAEVKAASPKPSQLNSPREPGESPVGSLRAKKANKATVGAKPVLVSKAQVKEQAAMDLIENPDARGTTWVQVAGGGTAKGTPRKTEANQTGIKEYLVKKPKATAARKLGTEEARAVVGMDIDNEATESDEGLPGILAQRQEVIGPSAGGDDSPTEGRQKKKKGLAPLKNTQTEGVISAEEAKRRARREREEEEANEERIQTAIRVLHYLRQDPTAPRPHMTSAGRAVKYSRKNALDSVNGGLLVALVRGNSAPDADAFAVFVELDLVVSTPLQRYRHNFRMGRLFMPADFPAEYRQPTPEKCGTSRSLKWLTWRWEKGYLST
jgi:hypothetical protein